MHQYIIDTKFAVESLLSLIYTEENEMESLRSELNSANSVFSRLYQEFKDEEVYDDFYDEMRQQFRYNRAAGFYKEKVEPVKVQIEQMEASLVNKKTSIEALCMSVLQVAKQGISTVYGPEKASAPEGRKIGNEETLKNVIWEGRNQALHCEEGSPRKAVKSCFKNLFDNFGEQFDIENNPSENKAKAIIKLLGWTSYEEYEQDMVSLLG